MNLFNYRDAGFENGYSDFQNGWESRFVRRPDGKIVEYDMANGLQWSVHDVSAPTEFSLGYLEGFSRAESDNH